MTPKLEKKLDIAYSKFIRTRDSKNGYFICCSCSRRFPIGEGDCGHFIQRSNRCTRWDVRNLNTQCRGCNRFQADKAKPRYAQFIVSKYGKETLAELVRLSYKVCKFYQPDGEKLLKEIQH